MTRANSSPSAFALTASTVVLLFASLSLFSQTAVVKITVRPVGAFSLALSTSFQAAPWTDPAFLAHPEIPTLLDALNPHHIRVQVIDQSIPQKAANQWDFTALDRQLQPILTAADHSPEIQLAAAPAFLYRSKTHFVTARFIAGYAAYCAGMVRHYNAPGNPHPIQYWGILNEPNYFHISPSEYVALYNAAVPAMLAVDPSLKLIALELGGEPSDERRYLPAFANGVRAQVDILGLHLYSSCDRLQPDQALFDTIPGFVAQVRSLERILPKLPLWILENNVNADFVNDGGNSTCNPSQRFADDPRGSSAFFLAWRATEFAQFARAGVSALYHWHFTGGTQYAEFNTEDVPAHLQLSYWLDLWLGRLFPTEAPLEILTVTNPDPSHIEVLATRAHDGKIAVLVANHAVRNLTDNNGAGAPRILLLDLSALSGFSTATQLAFDAGTDPEKGPEPVKSAPPPRLTIHLSGYGATFLILTPAANTSRQH
jgi:hypothetical protein